MAHDKATDDEKLTTIKVRDRLRRWLKIEAATRGVSMYELVDLLITKAQRGRRPWEKKGARAG